MMRPTALLRWAYLDCLGLPLDGFPAARVNRNGLDHYYILEQLWEGEGPEDLGREEWHPVRFSEPGM